MTVTRYASILLLLANACSGPSSFERVEPAPCEASTVDAPVPDAAEDVADSSPAYVPLGAPCDDDMQCHFPGGYCFPRHVTPDGGRDLFHTCALDCHDGWWRSACIVQHMGQCVQAEEAAPDASTPDPVCVPL